MATLTGKFNHATMPNTKLTISDDAATEIARILKKNNASALRIAVKGGGCSGMEYVIQLERTPHKNDTIFEGQISIDDAILRFVLVIDPKSLMYIEGTEIDWEIVNLSPKMVFRNPQAQSSCSCGLSFDPRIRT